MTDSIQILKERYLKNIKENPTVYIGIKLEFPIVNCQGGATDTNVAKNLLKCLLKEYDFEAERFDRDKTVVRFQNAQGRCVVDGLGGRCLVLCWRAGWNGIRCCW